MKSAKPEKVLFLINKLIMGGAEVVFIRDANELHAQGYDVYFAYLYARDENADSLPQLAISEQNIFSLEFKGLYDIRGYLRLISILKKNSICRLYSTLDGANVVARVVRPFVPSLGVYIREANVAQIKSFKFKVADLVLNFFCKKIVACSPVVKRTIIRYQPMHAHKVVVLENGVDIPEIGVSGRGSKEVVLVNVGRLESQKGLQYLLRSMKKLKDADFAWRLYIIGGGSLKQELAYYIASNGLSQKVILTGLLRKEEVAKYYRAADIFVFTPEWEGGPNVLLEAMSYGLCSVVTRFVGEEKVEEGRTGFLVTYGDEITLADRIALLGRDADLRTRMGQAGREKVVAENSMGAHNARLKEVLSL
jgi:glycosyltransferase involved in cell wall biosynthesis